MATIEAIETQGDKTKPSRHVAELHHLSIHIGSNRLSQSFSKSNGLFKTNTEKNEKYPPSINQTKYRQINFAAFRHNKTRTIFIHRIDIFVTNQIVIQIKLQLRRVFVWKALRFNMHLTIVGGRSFQEVLVRVLYLPASSLLSRRDSKNTIRRLNL